MLKIDRRSWHYRLMRWAWGNDKWGAWYLIGHAVVWPGMRREMLSDIGEPFREAKGLCGYLWLLLGAFPGALFRGITVPAIALCTYGVWMTFKALGWLLLWPIRLLAARTAVPDKAASTWRIVGEGAKAVHTHTCPRIKYVGGAQKEGVA